MLIDKCFEIIGDDIQYVYDRKEPYMAAQIINNTYNATLSMILYTEKSKIWH